jgi:hypothetical protein
MITQNVLRVRRLTQTFIVFALVTGLLGATGQAAYAQTMYCFDKAATIVSDALMVWGTPGDDVIVGSDRGQYIIGLGGNDWICGGGGDDKIWGDYTRNTGDPPSPIGGNDHLNGGYGNDILEGGAGTDVLYGANIGENDGLFGDFNILSNEPPWFATVGAADTILGGYGWDMVYGGPGNGSGRYRMIWYHVSGQSAMRKA